MKERRKKRGRRRCIQLSDDVAPVDLRDETLQLQI